jgi:hypothetical protein
MMSSSSSIPFRRAGPAALLLACVGGLFPAGAAGQDRSPRAGESYSGTVFGLPIEIPARDRRTVTYLAAGLLSVPQGPEDHRDAPAGELFLWRNRREGRELFRAEIAVIANSVRYNRALSDSGLESVLTLEGATLPWALSDSVEGMRDAAAELKVRSYRGGAGLGFRRPLAPGLQDNFFEVAMTYEPGYLAFRRAGETAPDFILPRDSFERRAHLRVRADAFERNLLELPHEGWAAGLDAKDGRRSGWRSWGGGVLGFHDGAEGDHWSSVTAYAVAASEVPFAPGDRHRFVASIYAGAGSHLDRFSAPRLDGFSNAGDWEALSRPVLPGAASDEFFPSRYTIANLEYRYEPVFFLFLQARGTLAWLDRPRLTDSGGTVDRVEPLHAVTLAATSGFFWNLSFEVAWSHNFGVLRRRAGFVEKGGNAFYVSLTKTFPSSR